MNCGFISCDAEMRTLLHDLTGGLLRVIDNIDDAGQREGIVQFDHRLVADFVDEMDIPSMIPSLENLLDHGD